MAQRGKELATKANKLNSILGPTWWEKRIDSHKLSSNVLLRDNVRVCIHTCIYTHVHTLCQNWFLSPKTKQGESTDCRPWYTAGALSLLLQNDGKASLVSAGHAGILLTLAKATGRTQLNKRLQAPQDQARDLTDSGCPG